MKNLVKFLFSLILLSGLMLTSSCRKDEFDTPPTGGQDPVLASTDTLISIAALKTGYVTNQYTTINRNWVISGVVTADDRSGNFYKTMVIEDATAAIAIRIDMSDFYTRYAIGRKVFVKLKGLVLGDYKNLIQLGGFSAAATSAGRSATQG